MKNFLIGLATVVLFPVWSTLVLGFLIGRAIAGIGSDIREACREGWREWGHFQ